jgi:hypothetical protein
MRLSGGQLRPPQGDSLLFLMPDPLSRPKLNGSLHRLDGQIALFLVVILIEFKIKLALTLWMLKEMSPIWEASVVLNI